MKLHLPKTLLMAVVAACLTLPVAQAEVMGNSYDSTYTYSGTVYTLDAATAHGSSASGTLSTNVYETTRDATNPTGWTKSDTATVTNSNGKWQSLFYDDDFNTLRIDGKATYSFKFDNFTVGGFIVEESGSGSTIESASNAQRDIFIGRVGLSADSYFGGSFTIGNTSGTASSDLLLKGTQNWYIADDKTVTFNTKNGVINQGNWSISGGQVSVSKTVDNDGGTLNAAAGVKFAITDISALQQRLSDSWSEGLTANGKATAYRGYVVIDGGTSNLTTATFIENESTVEKTLVGGSYFTHGDSYAEVYGVTVNSNLSNVADGVNSAGTQLIAIKEGVTLSAGTATFNSPQKLTGGGKYDLGIVAKNDATAVLGSGLTLDELWTGTVSLSGGEESINTGKNNTKSVQNIDFNSIGHAGSTVEIAAAGLYGYLKDGTNNNGVTFTPDLLLTGNLTLQNGNSNASNDTSYTHKFQGKIFGAGNLNIVLSGGDLGHLTFANDISGWTGKLRSADGNGSSEDLQTTITLTGSAIEVNAEICREGAWLNLEILNHDKTTTFNRNVTVSKLTATTPSGSNTLTNVVLGRGVKVTLTGAKDNSASGFNILTAHTDGNTIELKEAAKLNAVTSVKGGTVELIGTGTYALGAVTAADVYKGMNVLGFKGLITANTGAGDLNLINFNDVNQAAKLELSNFTGYLCSSNNGGTLSTNLKLKKTEGATYALKLQNGAAGNDYNTTFAGSIEGDGDMAYTWTNDSQKKQTHIFQGDTSGWKGKFVRDADDNGKHTVAKFTAGGNVFHSDGTGGVENKNAMSMMSVIIESTKDTTFNGSISNVSSVAVNSNTSFEQSVSTGALNVKEAITLSVAARISTETLTLGTGSKLEFAGGAITIANDYTVDAACIVLADDISFDSEEDYTLITVGNSTNAAIATLSDATLTVTGLDNWSGNGDIYTINNVDYAAKLVQDNNSLKISFTAMPVPEPTTATLSLLALAGLAARRRRK